MQVSVDKYGDGQLGEGLTVFENVKDFSFQGANAQVVHLTLENGDYIFLNNFAVVEVKHDEGELEAIIDLLAQEQKARDLKNSLIIK